MIVRGNITKHGNRRIKSRCGIPKSGTKKLAERAYNEGLKHSDCRGSLNRYLTRLYFNNKAANEIRLYINKVWIFHNDLLITTFEMPAKYRKTVKNILEKFEE